LNVFFPKAKLISNSRGRNNNKDWEELGPDGRPKEKAMICRACKESSIGGRTIIQCDLCNSHWHLDCLDPPQANPPKLFANGKSRAFFRCPLHVENDLRLIGNPQMAFRNPDGTAVRGHKLRQPRSASVYTPVVQRGHRNNGIIDVELDEDEFQQEDNTIPKLSERAITLDFIGKAKK
jgi:PHD-finger